MQTLLHDLRYGVRMLRQRPGFSVVAVLTLSLGIGVNTALFTVFNAFVLRPLPLKDPDSLVNMSGRDEQGERQNLFSYLDYLDYRDRNNVFSGLLAWNKVAVPLGEAEPARSDSSVLSPGDSEYVNLQMVSGNYFSVLGAEMALGRAFLPEEDLTPGTHPVIVLSHQFWQRHFDSDPNVTGRSLRLQGETFTVVGVTGREFVGTTPDVPAGWIPLMARDKVLPSGAWNHRSWLTDRNANSFVLIGRLKSGVTRGQAQAEMTLIARQLAQGYPGRDRKTSVALRSGMAFINLDVELLPLIIPLLVAVGLVLLIACANVANLLLARAATRQREIGVRLALGASRLRVIRQLLTESVLISALGGIAGLLLAVWTLSVLYPVVMSWIPVPAGLKDSFALNLNPDYRIFGFALLVSLVAGIASGLAPALQSSRPDLTVALKDEGSTFGQRLSQSGLRNALVVTQIAVCLMLLIGAGLLVRNLRAVQKVDTGLETKNVLTAAVSLRATENDRRNEAEVRRRFAERLRALPGVKSISQAYRQPLASAPRTTPITIPGREQSGDHPLRANYNFVSPQYFDTLGLRLVRGRAFTIREADSGAPVVVISESTARRFWPGEDAIGKRIGIGAAAAGNDADREAAVRNEAASVFPSFEIIGIARDTRSGWVWQKDETYLYVPLRPDDRSGEYLLLRTEGDPNNLMSAVRREAEALGNLRIAVRKVEDSLEFQMAPFRAIAALAGVLGLLALALASVGLYGVMSFIVTQRTREIGIRIALGAQAGDVITFFLKQGLRLIVVGVVFGIAGGVAISRLLAAALIDLSPLDPVAFGGVSVFLTLIALLATYLPARRATKVDPMTALRYE
ncbi:MAG TPA: ABC transporter permease [Blastocatellia bacterium]|nr:ABC transporter permease [Blastocatellia bacterium]